MFFCFGGRKQGGEAKPNGRLNLSVVRMCELECIKPVGWSGIGMI